MARMWRRKGYDVSCNCWVRSCFVTRIRTANRMLKDLNATLEALFQYADADADGMLNLLEFCELLHEMRLGLDTDSLIELFMLLGHLRWSHCWRLC